MKYTCPSKEEIRLRIFVANYDANVKSHVPQIHILLPPTYMVHILGLVHRSVILISSEVEMFSIMA